MQVFCLNVRPLFNWDEGAYGSTAAAAVCPNNVLGTTPAAFGKKFGQG